jgi:hypothetical protein
MNTPAVPSRQRDLVMFQNPRLWRCWPYLPVIRPLPNGPGQQLGVLYDALGACGRYGFSATVFLANLFFLPSNEEQFFALPKLIYDTPEELADAGWTVD